MVPFLPFFQILDGNWKNNPFPSPTSFLVPKQAFKRLEIAFWRKFEKSTKNSDLSNNRDTLFFRPCISLAFGSISKPFMLDGAQVTYF